MSREQTVLPFRRPRSTPSPTACQTSLKPQMPLPSRSTARLMNTLHLLARRAPSKADELLHFAERLAAKLEHIETPALRVHMSWQGQITGMEMIDQSPFAVLDYTDPRIWIGLHVSETDSGPREDIERALDATKRTGAGLVLQTRSLDSGLVQHWRGSFTPCGRGAVAGWSVRDAIRGGQK